VRAELHQVERGRLNNQPDVSFRRVAAQFPQERARQNDISQCIQAYNQDGACFNKRSTARVFQVIWCDLPAGYLNILKKNFKGVSSNRPVQPI
jgi:hypothetical protein